MPQLMRKEIAQMRRILRWEDTGPVEMWLGLSKMAEFVLAEADAFYTDEYDDDYATGRQP